MPPPEPVALDILQAVVARLEAISTSDPEDRFHTDAGENVSVGWLSADPPTLALCVHHAGGQARPDTVKHRVTEFLDLVVTARVPTPSGDLDGTLLEKVVADIQTAMENKTNRSLGGLAGEGVAYAGRTTVAPPKGGPVAWAYLTYRVGFHRVYGSPQTRA